MAPTIAHLRTLFPSPQQECITIFFYIILIFLFTESAGEDEEEAPSLDGGDGGPPGGRRPSTCRLDIPQLLSHHPNEHRPDDKKVKVRPYAYVHSLLCVCVCSAGCSYLCKAGNPSNGPLSRVLLYVAYIRGLVQIEHVSVLMAGVRAGVDLLSSSISGWLLCANYENPILIKGRDWRSQIFV